MCSIGPSYTKIFDDALGFMNCGSDNAAFVKDGRLEAVCTNGHCTSCAYEIVGSKSLTTANWFEWDLLYHEEGGYSFPSRYPAGLLGLVYQGLSDLKPSDAEVLLKRIASHVDERVLMFLVSKGTPLAALSKYQEIDGSLQTEMKGLCISTVREIPVVLLFKEPRTSFKSVLALKNAISFCEKHGIENTFEEDLRILQESRAISGLFGESEWK